MKLSFWTLGTPGWSNEAVVSAAARFGYQGVDLRCTPGGNVALNSSAQEIDEVKRLFSASGIEIASVLAYNKRGDESGVDWPAIDADLVENARVAAGLGARSMRVNAGRPSADRGWEVYLKGLAEVIGRAIATVPDVDLLVQNHPGSINAAQAGELASLIDSDRFGIGLSPDHCVDMQEDTIAVTEQIAPWVRQVHLADRERLADGRLKACLPGAGFVPNQQVLDILLQQGFEGWVSFKWEKPTYPDLPDAEVALPHFVSYMAMARQRDTD
jgi:sugar phosphate isomerase/epimerase